MIETILSPQMRNTRHRTIALANTNAQFEKDWASAISSDELVKRVHLHIGELYATKENRG
ncbi:MAG: hypothetical protein LBV31_01635 [Prevotellaceae bacterium]|jgi:hypothetical protein|nr:hypothetical protein [Prevotellaceae bacterium]